MVVHRNGVGKPQLLKTQLTLGEEHREINLKLTREISSCWLPYILTLGAMEDAVGYKASVVSPSAGPNTDLLTSAHWYNSIMALFGLTYFFLIGYEVCSVEGISYLKM